MSELPSVSDQSLGMGGNSARNDAFIVVGGKVYLTRRQVPQHYPISEHTLAKLASARRGPRFFKPTDKALYLPADIEAWIEAAAVMPLAEPGAAQVPAPAQRPKPGAPKGRGRAKPSPRTISAPGSSGRRLKSLPPTRDSWLRRHEQS